MATLQNPIDAVAYGFVPGALSFGPRAAVLHHNCLSCVIAVPAWRYLAIPCIGYYDDFGIHAPRDLAELALRAFTKFNDGLVIMPKKDIPEADSPHGMVGLAVSCRDECGEVIASLSLSREGFGMRITFEREFQVAGLALLATLRKLAAKLLFAQTAATGRRGWAVRKPPYELIATGGGGFSRSMRSCLIWWEETLPNMAPRLALFSNQEITQIRPGFIRAPPVRRA